MHVERTTDSGVDLGAGLWRLGAEFAFYFREVCNAAYRRMWFNYERSVVRKGSRRQSAIKGVASMRVAEND